MRRYKSGARERFVPRAVAGRCDSVSGRLRRWRRWRRWRREAAEAVEAGGEGGGGARRQRRWRREVETLGDGRRSGGRCGLEKAIRVMQLEGICSLMSDGIVDGNCWI